MASSCSARIGLAAPKLKERLSILGSSWSQNSKVCVYCIRKASVALPTPPHLLHIHSVFILYLGHTYSTYTVCTYFTWATLAPHTQCTHTLLGPHLLHIHSVHILYLGHTCSTYTVCTYFTWATLAPHTQCAHTLLGPHLLHIHSVHTLYFWNRDGQNLPFISIEDKAIYNWANRTDMYIHFSNHVHSQNGGHHFCLNPGCFCHCFVYNINWVNRLDSLNSTRNWAVRICKLLSYYITKWLSSHTI